MFTPKVSAATITVTTTADEDDDPGAGCSLFEAITAANTDAAYGGCPAGDGADTINVPAGTYVTNSNQLPAISGSLTILGDSAGGTIISGGQGIYIDINTIEQTYLLRDLTVQASNGSGIVVMGSSGDYVATLDRITSKDNTGMGVSHTRTTNTSSGTLNITNSLIQNNGSNGVYNNECQGVGTIYMTNSMVRDNQETGVFNDCGHIVMERVTVSGNASVNDAGGVQNGTGSGEAVVDMTNVTVANNTSVNAVGGVWAGPGATLINTTIARNQGGTGVGGLDGSTSPDTVTIYNTLVAHNQDSQCAAWGGELLAATNNLATDETCLEGNSGFNETPIDDMKLASVLTDAGGSASIGSGGLGGNVLTLALLNGSPAINAGNNDFCPAVDERNAGRPFENTCDVGAFEAHFTETTPGAGAGSPEATLADTGQNTWLISLAAIISVLAGGLVLQKVRHY